MNRREFVGGAVAAGTASADAGEARCRLLNARGEPVRADALRSFHICDFLLRVTPIAPQFAPGEVRFRPPEKPFRMAVLLPVPGFGSVYVYADNRGRGYTPKDFAGSEPLLLNREFAADRLSSVRNYIEVCRREGVAVPAGTQSRADSAAALFAKGEFTESLRDSLWAGEMLVFERARHAISKRGPREGFLFGANAFGVAKGKSYTDHFEAVFNYATLPFYRGQVERVRGKRDYSNVERIVEWLDKTNIVRKGHPLFWFVPKGSLPDWMKNPPMPFDEAKRSSMDYARDSVLKFRSRIHAWDVINEAHVQNALNFTDEQQIEMTAAAARAAREGDPTCFRVVNNCSTWNDYLHRKQELGRQNVYDYLQRVKDAGIDFEVIGLQLYYANRDMLETERNVEAYSKLGKTIHITELGVPSSSEKIAKSPFRADPGPSWHGDQWTETVQADWVEQFYTMCYSKPFIEAITWWDLTDPAFIPHGGFLNADFTEKESYRRIEGMVKKWRITAA